MLVTYAQRSEKSNAVLRIVEEDDMNRTFRYLNDKWSGELTGLWHAAPAGLSSSNLSTIP